MEFDKSKVYTAVNADELKIGSKVIVAAPDSLDALRRCVINNDDVYILKRINPECYMSRFVVDSRFIPNEEAAFTLAYLVSEPEEKKLKWTDLKIGDVIRNKELPFIKHLITGIDEGAGQVFFCNSWTKGDELEEWEKVEISLCEKYLKRPHFSWDILFRPMRIYYYSRKLKKLKRQLRR